MIMTEAQRPQVGEHHYRRVMALIAAPSPILLANLAWNLKNQGRMEESRELYEESVRLDPSDLPDPLRLGADGGDRPQLRRAPANCSTRRRNSHPGTRASPCTRAVLQGRIKRLRRARWPRSTTWKARREGGGLGPIEWSEKGLLLDKMGRDDEAFGGLQRGQAHAARADRPSLHGGRGRGAGRGASRPSSPRRGSKSCRAPASAPTSPSRSSSSAFPRSGTTMVEQTLTRASADLRRRRAADRRRAHRPHPAHAEQPAGLSGGVRRALARRPGRGARQSARLLPAARPPARRDRQGRAAGSPTRCR